MPQITTASVRIMRSYQFCNFEVTLGTDKPVSPDEVDALRQVAARLADKAVDDYKAAGHPAHTPPPAAQATESDGYIVDRSREYSQEVQ